MKSIYDLFDVVREATELKQVGEFEYFKLIQTGSLGCWDYRVGFLSMHLRIPEMYANGKNPQVRLCIGTIDDGSYGAWGSFKTKEKCQQKVTEIVEIFRNMIAFPTLDELNELLRPHALYVTDEG